jgi:hypothetical protein
LTLNNGISKIKVKIANLILTPIIFASLACMTAVQDREIVLGYSRHDFINEPKKNSKQN